MRSLKAFALPVLAGAMVAAAATLPRPDTEARAPGSVTVRQTLYACPTADGNAVATGRVAAHTGARVVALALPGKEPIDVLTPVDAWNETKVNANSMVVGTEDAKGAGAVGFFGGVAAAADGGGFGVGACPGVNQDSWFVGAGSGNRHFSTMTLTNLTASPAIADLSLWGDEGSVEAVDAEGIVLKAFQTRRIALDSLAAGEPVLAMHVNSRRGALSVAVQDTSTAVFRGTETLPPTSAPARRHTIAGITAGATGRQLVAVNPGGQTARVKITALGKDGSFVPTGLDDVKVPAGKVEVIDLPKSLGGDPVALRLTADRPLSASVRVAPSNKDFEYAVAGPPLAGPAVAPLSLGGLVRDGKLLLTAPGAKAKVAVTAFDSSMAEQGSADFDLKAGSTQSYDLAKKGQFDKPLADLAYVVVTPAGDVQGAAIYTRGSGVSAVPLTAAPLKTVAPQVQPGR